LIHFYKRILLKNDHRLSYLVTAAILLGR